MTDQKLANIYSPLFDHLNEEHGLTLLISEMDEIIKMCEKVKANWNEIEEICRCEKPKIKDIGTNTYACMRCFNEYRYPERGYVITKNYDR